MRKLAEFTLIALLAFPPLASADPVPASRRIDWTYTGVPGGIPNRTTICATFSPGATAAAINNAISSCNNGVVYLNAGTYNLTGIFINSSNVTLRGAGADKTILSGSQILSASSGANTSHGATITAGGTKSTFTMTVSSAANLTVGTMIEVDRNDDTNLVVNTGNQGGGTRNLTQVNVITGVAGSVITVRNPWIYDFTSASGAKVKWYFPNVKTLVGIENLKLEHNATNGTTSFIYCDSCWIKGVESAHSVGYHFFIGSTVNFEVRDSFVHEGATGPNNSGINFYGDYRYGANSSAKLENNILNMNFPAFEINGSSSGFYIGYNYIYGSNGGGGNLVTWTLDDGHAPFNIMNLYEGNISEMWGADNYYGGTGYGTALRNYFTGYNPNYGVYSEAVQLDRLAYNYSIVGNVLGSTLQGPIAYTGCTLYTSAHPGIYRLGYPNLGNCDTSPWDGFAPAGGYPDPKVTGTLLRWGNYDYFNGATRFAASEIPAGVPLPPDQVIPNSYYYASTPGWWKAGIAWPPIGPDVTGGNGDTSGHVNKIPAQVCWEKRNLFGGGSFNASACYAATTSPSITSALSASGTLGSPFSYTITATNNPTSFNATGLPDGLSVSTATGVISGTPTAAGTSSVALSATNAKGTGSATLALTINAAAQRPGITSPFSASGTVGTPFGYTITATNTPTSFNAAGLPAPLLVNTSTGVISGTPTAAGTSAVTFSATNAAGTGSAILTLKVNVAASPPAISSALTASGTVGTPFGYTITATNNPASFNAAGLPAGLSINSANGVISGTPAAAGTSSVTLSAANAAGAGSATLTLTINATGISTLFSGNVSSSVVQDDPNPVELGVKFYASRNGQIKGVLFYKNPQDTGTHTAHLWSSSGALLASATFTGETASGWQAAQFANPVAITANTTYIASYHSNGNYTETDNYFATAHADGPLTAPDDASSGGNGVYVYGSGVSFPSNTYVAANYWVDVGFQ